MNKLISENSIPDCSITRDIINLSMDNIVYCQFNLNSDEKVSFSNDKLNFDLVNIENNENIIIAECDTKKKQY